MKAYALRECRKKKKRPPPPFFPHGPFNSGEGVAPLISGDPVVVVVVVLVLEYVLVGVVVVVVAAVVVFVLAGVVDSWVACGPLPREKR